MRLNLAITQRLNDVNQASKKCLPSLIPHWFFKLKPATLAVLVQVLALLMVIVLSVVCYRVAFFYFELNVSFSVLEVVLLQSILATTFSSLFGMASWWRWIHFFFPIAVWIMSSWHVPNEFYMVGFIVSLSLFWTTFRSQVPFFPSRPVVWQQVAKLIPHQEPQNFRMIDIGSGLGDMSMHIAKLRPESRIEGIEIAPLPWLISSVRAWFKRSTASFKLGDYRELDFANYDVIFAYLSPAAMQALWDKAHKEMRSGSLLISLAFEIPGLTPSFCIVGEQPSTTIYVWEI